MLTVLVAIMAMSGAIQVVAIVRLAILRGRLGHLPHLSKQPLVRRWLLASRSVAAACLLATIAAVVIAKKGGEPFLLGGVPILLTIITHSIADNDTGHGDGDSGG